MGLGQKGNPRGTGEFGSNPILRQTHVPPKVKVLIKSGTPPHFIQKVPQMQDPRKLKSKGPTSWLCEDHRQNQYVRDQTLLHPLWTRMNS